MEWPSINRSRGAEDLLAESSIDIGAGLVTPVSLELGPVSLKLGSATRHLPPCQLGESVTTSDQANTQDGQLITRMGIELVDLDRNRLVATMPVDGNRQPYGLLHGGANAVLAETLGSIAASMHASDHNSIAVGLELSCTHHRAAREGTVTGVCTPLHVGRSVSTFEIVITNEEGKRTCTARLTCLVRPQAPGA